MAILITGGTKGIGLAIAERLARPGARFVLAYRSDDEAAAAARLRLEAPGVSVTTVRTDVGDPGAAAGLVAGLAGDDGPHHIVHGAAMIYPTRLLEADLTRFSAAMQVNGLSLLYLVHAALPHLSRGSGVVLISSGGARVATPNYAALGVGKAMAESLMRYLVPELAPRGVRINAVAPGLVATSSVAGMVGGETRAAALFEAAAKSNPSGRIADDGDYAGVVAFLLGPDASFIQGQVIYANGGALIP